nr:formimidoyltransferase-cyclodeaminase-like isoform X1 [Ciona intestinalis]|eukprot:XP_009860536.1 formimidoyltransferase-cyclodeaminase-like isoform X1 [Ciona intestinalis]
MKLIECVPNFSEGKNQKVIDAISTSIRETAGCSLVDVDAEGSTNRTVYTFVGEPDAVVQGALNAAKAAFKLIDMAKHKGEHPRFGALDVCPFIPVSNTTMDDCIDCANKFAKMLAEELQVPVYLYGFAAKNEQRKILSNTRSGEYEKLEEKLKNNEWYPDYGTNKFVSSWGATAVGARKFLIAYNINLISTKEQAHKIALNIRETGRGPSRRGRLRCVQGIGWYLDKENIAQVSTNVTDIDVTKVHQVYEEVCSDAKELNLPVVGSQIVGLVPLKVLLDAAEYYMKKDNLFILEEDSKIRLAVNRMGLSSLSTFNPHQRIIEYVIRDEARDSPLTSQSLTKFISSVGSRTASPGGGSVSAAVAAMGAALCTMTGLLTYGKKQWETLEAVMRINIPIVHQCMTELIPLVDKDSKAFDSFMAAMKMPKGNEEEIESRKKAMQAGILEAIEIPLKVITTCNASWVAVVEIAKSGNINCLSDVQVGSKCLETGIWGAYQNVLINLPQVDDENIREKIRSDAQLEMDKAKQCCQEVLSITEGRKNENSPQ